MADNHLTQDSQYAEWWGPPPEPHASITGSRVQAVGPERLPAAVWALAKVPDVASLNVRAGEHLAGLVLTAFNGPPIEVDVDGGPDFVFTRRDDSPWGWNFGAASTAAVEVKSLPGQYRHFEATAELGDSFEVRVDSIAERLIRCTPLLVRAQGSLESKAQAGWSRHLFLVAHLFDGIAVEGFDTAGMFLGHRLPEPKSWLRVDTLWVLFQGMGAAYWSTADHRWTSLILGARPGPEAPPDPDPGADLDLAERMFLATINHERGSPWQFGFTVDEQS
jgi:hypothetical protein